MGCQPYSTWHRSTLMADTAVLLRATSSRVWRMQEQVGFLRLTTGESKAGADSRKAVLSLSISLSLALSCVELQAT